MEQIGAGAGDLFDPCAGLGREGLQRMIGLTQRFEQRGTQRLQALSCCGAGAACGGTFEVQGRNELLEDRRVQGRGQVEGLDLGGHGGEEEGDGGQPLHGQALGLGEAFAGAVGQIGRLGEAVQARPHRGEPRGDALDRLCLSGLRIVRVMRSPSSRINSRASVCRACARASGFGRDQRGQGRLNAGLEGGRTPKRARRARLEYLLRRALGLPLRLRGGQAGLGVTHVARQG